MSAIIPKRSIRRHHRERLAKKRANYFSATNLPNSSIGKFIDTPKSCSCWMCGNPRKYFGEVTKQELMSNSCQDIEVKDNE